MSSSSSDSSSSSESSSSSKSVSAVSSVSSSSNKSKSSSKSQEKKDVPILQPQQPLEASSSSSSDKRSTASEADGKKNVPVVNERPTASSKSSSRKSSSSEKKPNLEIKVAPDVAPSQSSSSSSSSSSSEESTNNDKARSAEQKEPQVTVQEPVKEPINGSSKKDKSDKHDKAEPAPDVKVGVEEPKSSDITEHKMSPKEVAELYHVEVNLEKPAEGPGLSTVEGAERLARDGPNALTPPKQVPGIIKFLEGFTNVFMILLMVAGALSILAWALDQTVTINLVLGCILFGIVIITVFVEFMQGRKADRVMKVFRSLLPTNCKVIRDGREQTLNAGNLVKGDIVHIQIGDKVPADLRVIWAANAKVERSSMTGEAEPEPMIPECTSDRVVETKNLAFSGSLMINGEAYGIVVRTGDETLIGKIAGLASKKSSVHKKGKLCGLLGNPGEPTLVVEVKRFVFIISCMAIIMAIVFFVIGIATGVPPLFAFINGFIVVLIANIPQGLPATVTSCLSIASNRLAKKNVLVKRMNTVETLGAANVICSDKTGTLTMNQMTVMNMWFDQSFLPAKSTMELGNQFIHSKTYLTLFRIASLCNRAYFDKPADPEHEEGLEERRRSLEREGFTDVRPSMERSRGPRPSIELTEDNKFEVRLQRGNNRGPTFRPSMDGRAEGRPSLEAGRTEGRPSLEGRYEPGRPSLEGRGGKQSLELINFVNEARIETAGKVIVGDASETALFRYTSTFTDVDAIRTRFPKLFEIPFNSTNKWQLSIHDTRNAKKKHLLVIKGAPERILLKCKKALINGRKIVIDDAFREQYDRAYKTFGSAGERVLGFAQKKFLPEPHVKYDELHPNFPTEDYTFVGLISLEDPPRDGVPEAVQTCHEAGIKVIMVTGDHPFTAEAIARKVGIIGVERTREEVAKLRNCSVNEVQNDEYGAVVVPGSEIDSLTEEDWDNILSKPEIVFARTSPQQKLEIVKNNQRRGNVVAVTGDGVNDSPALKQADLGVAMGISGSDVAREAAEVVLLDDNFPSIIVGIREGRVIYDNLKKTIAYSLTHLAPEIVPVLCTLAFGIPIALNSILILLIDCGTEMAPAISFAYETPEGDIMKRKPRDVKREHLVNLPLLLYSYLQAGLVVTGLCFMAYFLIFMKYGIPASALPFSSDKHWINSGAEDFVVGDVTYTPEQQAAILAEVQSGYWITLVMCQFWHVWMCKTRIISLFKHNMRNWTMTMGVIIEACLIVIIVYVPFLHFPFGTANVDGYYWLINLGMVVLIWTWAEVRKAITRKYPASRFNKAFAW